MRCLVRQVLLDARATGMLPLTFAFPPCSNTPLYYARTKFNSGCGWPAFYDGVPGAIEEVPDPDGSRIEIVCAKCKGHLGHVFKGEGFPSPTDERHCVNGISLRYDASLTQPDDVQALKGLTLGDIPP